MIEVETIHTVIFHKDKGIQELSFVINGQPHSKKNSREFRQHGKAKFTVPGKAFEYFQSDALSQLLNEIKPQMKFGGQAIEIDYIFFKKGMMLADVDNMICSINDVLQHERLKVFDDDKQIMKGKFEIVPGNTEWRTFVTIRVLPNPFEKGESK